MKRPDFGAAINQLEVSRDIVTNNIPWNEKHNPAQATLERTNAKSFEAAIKELDNRDRRPGRKPIANKKQIEGLLNG